MSWEHSKLISGYKILQRTLGSTWGILWLAKPSSRTTCPLGVPGPGELSPYPFKFSVEVKWNMLIMLLSKGLQSVGPQHIFN